MQSIGLKRDWEHTLLEDRHGWEPHISMAELTISNDTTIQ